MDNPPLNKAGHHGLFFDRLDQRAIQTVMVNTEVLDPGARGVYQNRNRIYEPRLGRFLQRDPNGCWTVVMGLEQMGAVPGTDGVKSFAEWALYNDGMSTYSYLHSAPVRHTDPRGTCTLSLGSLAAISSMMDLRGTEAKANAAAGVSTIALIEQMGVTLIGGGTLVNATYGDDIAALLRELLGSCSSHQRLTPRILDRAMDAAQHQQYGDPSGWTPKGENPGTGEGGGIIGDVRYYYLYLKQQGQRLEVHLFRDAGGTITAHTIKIVEGWSRQRAHHQEYIWTQRHIHPSLLVVKSIWQRRGR